jgi:hypothetical protein
MVVPKIKALDLAIKIIPSENSDQSKERFGWP